MSKQSSASRVSNKNVIHTVRGIAYPDDPAPTPLPDREAFLLRSDTTNSSTEGRLSVRIAGGNRINFGVGKRFRLKFSVKPNNPHASGDRCIFSTNEATQYYYYLKVKTNGAIEFWQWVGSTPTLLATSSAGALPTATFSVLDLLFNDGDFTLKVGNTTVINAVAYTRTSITAPADSELYCMGGYDIQAPIGKGVNGYIKNIELYDAYDVLKRKWYCDDNDTSGVVNVLNAFDNNIGIGRVYGNHVWEAE